MSRALPTPSARLRETLSAYQDFTGMGQLTHSQFGNVPRRELCNSSMAFSPPPPPQAARAFVRQLFASGGGKPVVVATLLDDPDSHAASLEFLNEGGPASGVECPRRLLAASSPSQLGAWRRVRPSPLLSARSPKGTLGACGRAQTRRGGRTSGVTTASIVALDEVNARRCRTCSTRCIPHPGYSSRLRECPGVSPDRFT